MTVVLLELSHTRKTTQSTGSLVSVQNSEVGDTHGKFPVTTLTVAKENKVTRAVHRLESPLTLLDIKLEHIVLVVSPVARSFPDADIVHVGGLDLLVATLAVLGAQERLDLIEDLDSVGEEEGTTGGRLIEEEEFLLLADPQVVALLSLFQELQVLGH